MLLESLWTRICENVSNFEMWVTLISFHPQALNAPCFLLEHQGMFKPFLIVVFESLSSPQCEKDGSQNHTVTARKGSNKQKMLKDWRFRRTWRIILKNRAQFYCSEQTRDSWTIITKQKQSWIIQGNTHSIKVVLIISAIFFVLWNKCKHILYKISYSGQY